MKSINQQPSYIFWHFIAVPKQILKIWINFSIFFYHYFSIGILLKTLFLPWKRVYRVKQSLGISIQEISDRLSYNLISRCLGFLIRSSTISFGLIIIIINFLVFLNLFFVWLIIPILTFPLYFLKFISTFHHKISRNSHPQKISETILSSNFGIFIISRCGLSIDLIKQIISNYLSKIPLENIYNYLVPEDLFLFIYQNDQDLKSYLFSLEIEEPDLIRCINWFKLNSTSQYQKNCFWDLEYLLRIPSIGKNWASGFTPNTDDFTTDFSTIKVPFGNFVGRQKEINSIERILSKKSENSVLLVGQTGVGKHPLLIHLAHEISKGSVLPNIEGKRLLSLEMEKLFKQYSNISDYKSTLTQILTEADSAGNIVLVIDEFDRYISSNSDRIDISDIVYHILTKNNLQIIAMTTPEAYYKYFQNNNTLNPLFETVEIKPLTKADAYNVIFSIIFFFETKKIKFQYQAIKTIIECSDRYIKSIPYPEKAISLIDGIASEITNKFHDYHLISKEDAQKIIEEKIKIPLKTSVDNKQILLDLENKLHQKIIGQDEAVKNLASAIRRSATDVNTKSDKPIGSFLFLGPTGVGKTETAKAIASIFFSNSGSIIRFDMSEYQDSNSIKQFLGDFQSGKIGTFVQLISDQPYSVILLDEFEKANPNLINIFLTAFDEGYVTDAFGKKVYLSNNIIIATSNAGAQYIHESVKQGIAGDSLKQKIIEYVFSQHIFSPELINRFDAVIIYLPLTNEQAGQVLDLYLQNFNQKLMQEHGIIANISPDTKIKILSNGFDQSYGGRAIARAVQTYVEDPLALKILNGEIKRGESVII
jgi:ATP-dependent Clp protease ATP-binding subunit ClpC